MKSHTMKILVAFTLIMLVNLSCSKSDDSSGGGGPVAPTPVNILAMSYSPSSLTVKVGTVVKWTNTDVAAHTVTSNDGSTFSSLNIAAGATYSYTTLTAGNFPYHCTIHGMAMSGTLVVTP